MARDKVILAYSGGLDTSVMVPWIGEKYNLDVVTLTIDLARATISAESARRPSKPAPWTPSPLTPGTCLSIVSSGRLAGRRYL